MSSANPVADDVPPPTPEPNHEDLLKSTSRQPEWKSYAADATLWRNKTASISLLAVSTLTWTVLHPCGLNVTFVTAFCYLAIILLTALFLCSFIAPFLGRHPPDLSQYQISEESAVEYAGAVRETLECLARRVLAMCYNKEWRNLMKVISGLGMLAVLGSRLDFLTAVILAIMVSLLVPPVYVKYEDRINGVVESTRKVGREWADTLDEKVVKRVRNKVATMKQNKQKKAE